VAAADDPAMSAPVRTKVRAAADYLAVAPAVVRGRTDLPVGRLDCRLPGTPEDSELLDALAEQFGLASSVARLRAALAG
jgi:hypothetical protein